MKRNGGYVILDLTDYDLSQDIDDSDEASLGDANELTEDVYNELLSKIKYASNSGKPLMVVVKEIYDDATPLAYFSQIRLNGDETFLYYFDIADTSNRAIKFNKINDKYYLYSSNI